MGQDKKIFEAKSSLNQEIEKQNVDAIDPDIEQYVAPLLESIQKLKIEKIDFSTPEKALEAIPMLDGILEKISAYKKNSSILKTLLKEKRDNLIKSSQS